MLGALTIRGRALLAAGVTTLVCSALLGNDALARVGALAIALPPLAAFVHLRRRAEFEVERSLAPPRVSAGHSARVRVRVRNTGTGDSGLVMVEDRVPYALGFRQRFVLPSLAAGAARTHSYPVQPDLRGRYTIGPLYLRTADRFGLAEQEQVLEGTHTMLVTPPVEQLPSIALTGSWTGSGDNRPRVFATGSPEDVTIRDYRDGDDLRRVHWASSARSGQLMVRREEQPWQSRATVLIDNREHAHRGQGTASSLEAAITHAASIAVHLTERGFAVRLVTARGADHAGWHERAGNVGPLLESLAVMPSESTGVLDTSWLADNAHPGVLIAVLGSLAGDASADAPALRRMRQHADRALAIRVDVDQWGGSASTGRSGATSSAAPVADGGALPAGWSVVTAGAGESTAQLWQRLGAMQGPAARTVQVAQGRA